MITADSHMHTCFSGDCKAAPSQMADAAVSAGLLDICLTDHLDYDYREEPGLFLLDLPAYKRAAEELKESWDGKVRIRFGIEIGLQPHLLRDNRLITQNYDFDFVIGSSHIVHGQDPYYPPYWEGKTEEEGIREYFSSIEENLDTDPDFDVYGHLDYVVRYGKSHGLAYRARDYADQIDPILRRLIETGKGIELNTAGFLHHLSHPNPTEEIISRYRALGGEIITVGSDAHRPEDVGFDFDRAREILLNAGFCYYTVFVKRKPQFIPL